MAAWVDERRKARREAGVRLAVFVFTRVKKRPIVRRFDAWML